MSRQQQDARRLQELFADLLKADDADPLKMIASLAACEHRERQGGPFGGRVVKVYDGDTLSVQCRGVNRCVRLFGIDAPEDSQEYAAQATVFMKAVADNQIVTVAGLDVDMYGRLVAVVTLPDGRLLNHELVAGGFAWWYQHFAPRDTALQVLEVAAKRAGKGLWRLPDPVAPWDWRRDHK